MTKYHYHVWHVLQSEKIITKLHVTTLYPKVYQSTDSQKGTFDTLVFFSFLLKDLFCDTYQRHLAEKLKKNVVSLS